MAKLEAKKHMAQLSEVHRRNKGGNQIIPVS
jgi:hypothetical protein